MSSHTFIFRTMSEFQLCIRARTHASEMHNIFTDPRIWRIHSARQSHLSAQADRCRYSRTQSHSYNHAFGQLQCGGRL